MEWVKGLEIGGSRDLNNIKDDWDGRSFMASDDVDLGYYREVGNGGVGGNSMPK